MSVGVLCTAKSDAWGDGSVVFAAARGSVAAAVLAGAIAIGATDLMSLSAVCSAVALVSGSIFASFSGCFSASGELAIGVWAAGAMLFKASFSGAAGAAATVSATGSATNSATDAAIFDSDDFAAASWLASAVAGASAARAAVLTTYDSPRIAGDTSNKFQKILFIFLTPSHYKFNSIGNSQLLIFVVACLLTIIAKIEHIHSC